MSNKQQTLVRFIVVGDSYVGKTRLLRQFVDGEAKDEHETVCDNINVKHVTVKIE